MNTLKYYCAGLFASCLILTTSCNQAGGETAKVETSTSQIEIPELLARSGKVGSEMEANKMFNTYKALKADIASNPKDYASRLKMADLFIVEARATGNYGYYYPAAVKMIDGVLVENPEKSEDKFRALTSKAVIQLSYHKFEEARETGREALKLNPHNSRVYGILTDANVEMGDYQQAVVMADSMVAIRPDLRSYSRVSYLREIFGEVKGAQQAMKMAIKAGAPGHEETTWAHVTLGNLYENYGQLDSAKMQYEIALAEREGYPFALKGLASVEAKKGNNEEAIKLLEQAIDNRKDASFYEDLALVYQQMNRMDEKAKARDMAFAELKGLAGNGHHNHGDKNHKHEDANEHGHTHEVGLEMARLYVSLTDDYDEALHNAMHEYTVRPDNIEVNRVLAYIYLKKGKLKQAKEHFEKAGITNTKDPQQMLIGGLILLEDGQKQKGEKMIKDSFKVNPYQKGAIVNHAKKQMSGGVVAQL